MAVDSKQQFSRSDTTIPHRQSPRCRSTSNAPACKELSALTQLTRLQIDYTGSLHRELLCTQLAQLTGLRELDAPAVLQADGGHLVRPYCLTVLPSKQQVPAPGANLNSGSTAVIGVNAARAYLGSTYAEVGACCCA